MSFREFAYRQPGCGKQGDKNRPINNAVRVLSVERSPDEANGEVQNIIGTQQNHPQQLRDREAYVAKDGPLLKVEVPQEERRKQKVGCDQVGRQGIPEDVVEPFHTNNDYTTDRPYIEGR